MNTMISDAVSKEGLAHSLRRIVDEAEQFLDVATYTGDQKLDAAREKFVKNLRGMRAQLEDLEDDAMHGARRAARTAGRAVQEHPYSAIGVAAGVVVLVGILALTSRRW